MSHKPVDWRVWRGRVFVTCPGCQSELELDGHVPDSAGCLSPSLDCPTCSWHHYGRLVGWIEEADHPKIRGEGDHG